MSGPNGEGVPSIANDAVAAHGPVIFSVVVHADGTVRWTSPKTGDPMTDEILKRGWLDKVREIATVPPRPSPLAI
jgi:hypothetical protein